MQNTINYTNNINIGRRPACNADAGCRGCDLHLMPVAKAMPAPAGSLMPNALQTSRPWFQEQAVSRFKTGRFAAWNRPYRSLEQAVSRRGMANGQETLAQQRLTVAYLQQRDACRHSKNNGAKESPWRHCWHTKSPDLQARQPILHRPPARRPLPQPSSPPFSLAQPPSLSWP